MKDLASLTDAELVHTLIGYALRVPHADLNALAAELLTRFGRRPVPELVMLAASPGNATGHRVRALGVLARIGPPYGVELIDLLVQLRRTRNKAVREAAAKLFGGGTAGGYVGSEAAVPPVLKPARGRPMLSESGQRVRPAGAAERTRFPRLRSRLSRGRPRRRTRVGSRPWRAVAVVGRRNLGCREMTSRGDGRGGSGQRRVVMIREVSRCPYCGAVSAGVDDDVPDLVLAPDRADGNPCPHLALLSASLNAYRADGSGDEGRRSGHWLWVRDEGSHAIPAGPVGSLCEFIDLAGGRMLADDQIPTAEYRVGGGTAGIRESIRSGSGEFLLTTAEGSPLAAYLDGWALYSPTPELLVAEARRLGGPGYPSVSDGGEQTGRCRSPRL